MSHIIGNISKCGSNCIRNLLISNCWHMFHYCFICNMRLILCFMFNLFIIGIRDLNWLIICMLNCLIISHSFRDFYRIAEGCVLSIDILSFIWDLFMSYDWFVISVRFLNWYIFGPGFWLRSSESLSNRLCNNRLINVANLRWLDGY